MSVVVDRSDKIAVTVTPTQARHIATAIRLDFAARWEKEWLHPLARREECFACRDDESTAPPDVQRQGEDMIAAALVIHHALVDA
jgi:hypothetical protein